MSDCQRLGDCDDARIERLYEYLDGALSHEDLVEIKEHLEGCTECAREHDLECVIRSVVKRSCTEAAPQTLKAGILARINQIQAAADH
ncbi:Anti-sigma factor RsrA [Arthrobacter saudimassiliensis]|uniref:Anti-sigma factor RsrA n=1 Tax=Arthrobacter saudimassiliensis TaxID=1461584 RepID=A0A078MUV8_9MICC|nr:Anti-sigma factor RsrA [Arthrobacter saudimassiliensis]